MAIASLAALIGTSSARADPNDLWEWPGLGLGGPGGSMALDLVTWDAEGGPYLYACGQIWFAGGKPAQGVVRWDGTSWSEVGGGIEGSVGRLLPFDDGTGPRLIAGGGFIVAGGSPAYFIAQYKNGIWSALGVGFDADVNSLAAFDDGTGIALYATGAFTKSGSVPLAGIAKWNGEQWMPLKAGTGANGTWLEVFDDGVNGPALFVGGAFLFIDGKQVNGIAKWNGIEWSGLAGGLLNGVPVTALKSFDDGSGPKLFVSGNFTQVGTKPANGMATWNGKEWAAADQGLSNTYPANVQDFAIYDAGNGPVLYAAGGPNVIAKWVGDKWSLIDFTGLSGFPAYTVAVYKDSKGARLHLGGQLFVGGEWKNIARQTSTVGGTEPCGDLTGDGFVNQQDLGILLGDWGCAKGVGLCPGDCDNDGDTDQADLGILLANWEKPCP